MNKLTNGQASRRAFMRSTGKTLAAAIGMAALPGIARASGQSSVHGTPGASTPNSPLTTVTYHCYANSEACGTGCTSGNVEYHCLASGCPSFCDGCLSFASKGQVWTFTNPGCV